MKFSHQRSIGQSAREYGRGIAGGLMFSLPLLYTMEVWWAGFVLHPWRILLYMVCTFGLLFLYNRFAGLRRDATLREVAIDSMEEMGIGLVLAAMVLWLTGRIEGAMPLSEIAGKITLEGMTVAIGVSVGTAQLGADCNGDEGYSGDGDGNGAGEPGGYLPEESVALCGAVLFAANVAPTEEMIVIAMESHPGKILMLAVSSLALGWLVLHFAGIHGSGKHIQRDTPLLVFRGVVTTYAVALAAGAGCLYFFGRFDGEPWRMVLNQTVVIGLPAVLGASAGRLLLQIRTPGS